MTIKSMAIMLAYIGLGFIAGVTQSRGVRARANPPATVHQKLVIIPDVSPASLADQIRMLNDQGITVTREELLVIGDKVTIFVDKGVEASNGREQ